MKCVCKGSVAVAWLEKHRCEVCIKRFWLRKNRKIFNGARTLRTFRTLRKLSNLEKPEKYDTMRIEFPTKIKQEEYYGIF